VVLTAGINKMMNINRITFLIGSGASLVAGMPKTQEITDAVCGINISESDSERIISPEEKYNCAIANFIKRELEDIYKSRYGIEMHISYEDIYHVFDQVCNDDVDEYPNPLLSQSFKNNYLERMLNLIEQLYPSDCKFGRNIEIKDYGKVLLSIYDDQIGWIPEVFDSCLFPSLKKHIEDILISMLGLEPNVEKLSCLWKNIVEDPVYERCDIFSLNHDLVIEKILNESNIPFNNGIIEKGLNKHKVWDRNSFYSNQSKMQLYKLHGSIDWFYHKRGIVTDHASGGERALLIGTYMKMLQYAGHDVFLDLFHLFYRRLFEDGASILIVCGYGFRDRGINNIIINWYYDNDDNKIIIIDPDIDGLKNSKAFPAIQRLMKDPKAKYNIIEIQSPIERVSWDDLKNHINI
jgi:hypothetical protein